VSEVLYPGLKGMPTSAVSKIVEYYNGVDAASLNVAIASGPFTADTDLEYSALDAITALVADSPVNAIILVGPFVDARHPLLKSGKIDKTPEEIFNEQVSSRLDRMLNTLPDLKVDKVWY
jgi:DNA polymerase alpha subunit B